MATYTDNYNLIKPSYSEIADVATINTNMNTIDDIMHSTQISLAPAYDSTKTYNIDDVVMYELLMYKCKENGVTGTWNASKWERTTASESGSGGGSGGGGSTITYGYGGTPSFNGNDGDVHIVLNSLNKKKGEFMWLNNQWTLIEGSGEVALKVYDNGVEGVAWSVTGGTKNATNISLNVGGGTFTNYAITDTAINVTNYSTLTVVCKYRDQNYTKVIDLTNVSGNKYISFLYVTDSNHNECAVGLTDTNSPSPTYRVDSRNGGTAECIMYSCTLE